MGIKNLEKVVIFRRSFFSQKPGRSTKLNLWNNHELAKMDKKHEKVDFLKSPCYNEFTGLTVPIRNKDSSETYRFYV